MHTTSSELAVKVRLVRERSAAATLGAGEGYALTPEVAAGVRLVLVSAHGMRLVFSLWDDSDDVIVLSGDRSVPATTRLLAVDEELAHHVVTGGHALDLGDLTPSPTVRGLHFALLHYGSHRQIHRIARRMTMGPGTAAAA